VAEALSARGIPLVYSTGNTDHGSRDGYSDRPVLRKPFRYEELVAILTHAGQLREFSFIRWRRVRSVDAAVSNSYQWPLRRPQYPPPPNNSTTTITIRINSIGSLL
jgi:hypothetical protein